MQIIELVHFPYLKDMNFQQFFKELKYRSVHKVAVTYAIVGWLILQIGSIVLPTVNGPEWVMQIFIFFLIIGFPFALVLAWAQGVKKKEKGLDKNGKVLPDTEELQVTSSTSNPLSIAVLSFEDMSPNND